MPLFASRSALLLLLARGAAAHTASPLRGFVYSSWAADGYGSNASDTTLLQLPTLGVQVIELMWTQYVDNSVNATDVHATSNTPTDASLRHAVASAHAAGLRVAFKPHVDCLDGVWRANIGTHYTSEAQWSAWWLSYGTFITTAATLARDVGASGFNIGTELDGTHGREAEWRALIAQVRAILPAGTPVWLGPNWQWANVPGYTLVRFWDALDFLGVDMYAPLAHADDPTLAVAIAGWAPIVRNLSAFSAAHGNKGVIFAEMGYASYAHAATDAPGCCSGAPDPTTQAILYESFFAAVWPQPWMAGAFWWAWPSDDPVGDPCGTGFDVWRKPAAAVLARGYTGVAAPPAALAAARPRALSAPAAPSVVYANGVTAWQDWSWSATLNLRDAASPWPTHTYAAAATVHVDGSVALHSLTNVSLAGFSSLQLDVRTTDAAHGAFISVYLCACTDCGRCPTQLPTVKLVDWAPAGSCALPSGWARVTVPLSALAPGYEGTIQRVQLGALDAGKADVVFSFDNLAFV